MWTSLKCTALRHEAQSHCCKTVATIVSRTFSSSPAETPSPWNTSSSPLPQPRVPTTFVCLYGFHCCSTAFLNRYVINLLLLAWAVPRTMLFCEHWGICVFPPRSGAQLPGPDCAHSAWARCPLLSPPRPPRVGGEIQEISNYICQGRKERRVLSTYQ